MIDKPLPPAVFGEEPQYVAIRKDVADIRAPMTSGGLQKIHDDFLGAWTYLTIAEVIERINAQPAPPPTAPSGDADKLRLLFCGRGSACTAPTAPSGDADKLRRLQLAATAYANQVEMFTSALRHAVSED